MNRLRQITLYLLLLLVSTMLGQDNLVIDMRNGLAESRVRAIRQMPDGRMAIATTATIDIYDGTHFKSYKLDPNLAYPLPEYTQRHRDIVCDSMGRVWLRHERTLYVVDTKQDRVVDDVGKLIRSLGLTDSDIAAWRIKPKTTASIKVADIMCHEWDCYGGEWIGTKERGIIYLNPKRMHQFHTYADSSFVYRRRPNFCSPRASELAAKYAPSATNCSLDAANGYAYLGTRDGLLVFDAANNLLATITEQDGLSTNNVQAVVADQRGNVWITTANGISRIQHIERDTFCITNYGRLDGIDVGGREFRTCQIHVDSFGQIVAGFVGGIVCFNPDSVNAPRYTFRYPRATDSADVDDTYIYKYWLLGAFVVVIVLIIIALIRKRHKQNSEMSPTIANQDNEQTHLVGTVSDAVVDKLKVVERQSSADNQFLDRLQVVIEDNIGTDNFSVQKLSELMAMDRTVLYRRMQTLTGMSPSSYLKRMKMNVAARLLADTNIPIGDIANQMGFATTKYFNKVFHEAFGMSPTEYRNQSK